MSEVENEPLASACNGGFYRTEEEHERPRYYIEGGTMGLGDNGSHLPLVADEAIDPLVALSGTIASQMDKVDKAEMQGAIAEALATAWVGGRAYGARSGGDTTTRQPLPPGSLLPGTLRRLEARRA